MNLTPSTTKKLKLKIELPNDPHIQRKSNQHAERYAMFTAALLQ
jgi:hypothetical protein